MLTPELSRQHGFTFIELLISSGIGAIVLSGTIILYSNIIRGAFLTVSDARLDWELHSTMELMIRDLRRAGYWAGEPGVDDLLDNPFTNGVNKMAVGSTSGEDANSCITFSYDRDQDKRVGVGRKGTLNASSDRDNVEQFGFRLHHQALESRISGRKLSCTQGRWQDITSQAVVVTSLIFETQASSSNLSSPDDECINANLCQTAHYLRIRLQGHTKDQPNKVRTVDGAVLLRNSRIERRSE